ncbi:MAG: HAD family hydrolase [archaeon]
MAIEAIVADLWGTTIKEAGDLWSLLRDLYKIEMDEWRIKVSPITMTKKYENVKDLIDDLPQLLGRPLTEPESDRIKEILGKKDANGELVYKLPAGSDMPQNVLLAAELHLKYSLENSTLYDDAIDVLSKLHRQGKKIAFYSNINSLYAPVIEKILIPGLEKAGIVVPREHIILSYEVKKCKPMDRKKILETLASPNGKEDLLQGYKAFYDLVVQSLGISREKILVIGDGATIDVILPVFLEFGDAVKINRRYSRSKSTERFKIIGERTVVNSFYGLLSYMSDKGII